MSISAMLHSILLMACLASHVQADVFHMAGMRRAVEATAKEPHKPPRLARGIMVARS
ncbi:hypothetical protein ACLB6G_08540 [Zhengella sp. ZM62]|uniref:hypothetical protein n=1 Tax=Zhengella sedimenti TaxID=3390035 RepID=UPI003976401C